MAEYSMGESRKNVVEWRTRAGCAADVHAWGVALRCDEALIDESVGWGESE